MDNKYIKRFWDKVAIRGDDECWEWTAAKFSGGYGAFKLKIGVGNYIQTRAHRVSYIISNGNIPNGMLICHTCNNKSCVNPKHLYAGTAKDNSRDMRLNGRSLRGEKNPCFGKFGKNHPGYGKSLHGEKCPRTKLKDSDIIKILWYLKNTELTNGKIGKMFGVTQQHISAIKLNLTRKYINRNTWKINETIQL